MVAPHCVNTLRILHAAYDATKGTFSLSLSHGPMAIHNPLKTAHSINETSHKEE